MIKTRNQLDAVKDLLLDYAQRDHVPVTIERVAFALNGTEVTAIPAGGLSLVAFFTDKAIRRILKNPRDCSCYLLSMVEPFDSYCEAFALIVQINPPEEADGSGRAVFYGATIDHVASGVANLYQVVQHPKRKAKKTPALGFAGGSLKIKAKAPKKHKREAYALPLDENTGDLMGAQKARRYSEDITDTRT